MKKPILSVITIVYNGEEFIEKTVKNVLSQTYPNIEYIIIDGASKDNTLKILDTYKDKAVIISEKDKGIYDAMNKGLSYATGDYIVFMNAGDCFYSEKTVENVFNENSDADIIYGDTIIVNQNDEVLGARRLRPPSNLNWKSFRKGMLVCHQSFWVKRSIASKYNLKYKIASDIDWCISCLKKANNTYFVNGYITRYLSGGVSWKHQKQALKERLFIMMNYYGVFLTTWSHLEILLRFAKEKISSNKKRTN